jgi:DNA polymerase-3 subunit alpha
MNKLTILILDTETNGLPKNRFAPVSQTDAFPAILQLSWAIYTITGDQMTPGFKKDITLALDPAIPWDSDAAKIHGITEEQCRKGSSPVAVFLDFFTTLRSVDCIVAHNLSFDKPVIRAAAYAASMKCASNKDAVALRSLWPQGKSEFCTMTNSRELLKIPSAPEAKHPFKLPRLNELYTWLYGYAYDMSGCILHTAQSDTACLALCIEKLLQKGLVRVSSSSLTVVLV